MVNLKTGTIILPGEITRLVLIIRIDFTFSLVSISTGCNKKRSCSNGFTSTNFSIWLSQHILPTCPLNINWIKKKCWSTNRNKKFWWQRIFRLFGFIVFLKIPSFVIFFCALERRQQSRYKVNWIRNDCDTQKQKKK